MIAKYYNRQDSDSNCERAPVLIDTVHIQSFHQGKCADTECVRAARENVSYQLSCAGSLDELDGGHDAIDDEEHATAYASIKIFLGE